MASPAAVRSTKAASRADEAVERVGGVDRGESGDAAGAGQDGGNVGLGEDREIERAVAAAQPLAGAEEDRRKQEAERDAHARSEQPLLDRVAHEEDRAERQRQPADQHRPARADLRFQRFLLRSRRARGSRFGFAHGRRSRDVRRAAALPQRETLPAARWRLAPPRFASAAPAGGRPSGEPRLQSLDASQEARANSGSPCAH